MKAPAWIGLTTMVTTTDALFAMLPSWQVTLASHVPCVAVAETKVVPAGSGSLRTTRVAVLGPLFLIVTV